MRKLILLVDDDSSLSDCLSEVVQMEGVDVVCLPNGEEALHWLHHSDRLPSLILADLRMPVMDGARFLEEKDKCGPPISLIPVLVLTAAKDDICGNNIVGVLRKPFGIEDFLPYVNSIVPSESSTDEERAPWA
jgi:CheY-like chemotaxis protein